MAWRKCTFLEAVKGMLKEFDTETRIQSLALVWRSESEYNVMDEWLLRHILSEMDVKKLRVILWLNREEAAQLVSMIAVGVK